MTDQEQVRRSTVGRVRINGFDAGEWSLQLRYSIADPFALWITFATTEWCCERGLLLEALAGMPAGEGDVRIRCDDTYTYIELTSPDGRAEVRIPRGDTEALAKASLDLVRLGAETFTLDFDALIAEIMMPGRDW